MYKNIGINDKTIRISMAVLILITLAFLNITGALAIILGLVAVVLLVTSFLSFCPLYSMFKMKSK